MDSLRCTDRRPLQAPVGPGYCLRCDTDREPRLTGPDAAPFEKGISHEVWLSSDRSTDARVRLPVATSLPSAVTVPAILIRAPIRPTTSAVASSRTPGTAAAGNLKLPRAP